jgi:hypothetical protein
MQVIEGKVTDWIQIALKAEELKPRELQIFSSAVL